MIYAIVGVMIISYFIGCIHGSNIAQLLSGVNLKETGSGNAGASNATLSLGWKYGILVGLIDIGKGIFAILLTKHVLMNYTAFVADEISVLIYLSGASVILGHNFPVHMKFRGGKGTASLIGIFLTINWKIGLVSILLLVIVSLLSDYLLIGVFGLYISFGLTTLVTESTIWPFLIIMSLLALAFYLHLENMERIKLGTEPKVTAAFKKRT